MFLFKLAFEFFADVLQAYFGGDIFLQQSGHFLTDGEVGLTHPGEVRLGDGRFKHIVHHGIESGELLLQMVFALFACRDLIFLRQKIL